MKLIFLSLILDLLLNNFFPILPYQLTFFQPFLWITALISFIYFSFSKKNCFLIVMIISFCYDLLFGEFYLLNTVLILLLYGEIFLFVRRFRHSFLSYLLVLFFGLCLYFIQKYFILIFIGIKGISLSLLLIQIAHSLILNFLYGLVLYYFFGIKTKKR